MKQKSRKLFLLTIVAIAVLLAQSVSASAPFTIVSLGSLGGPTSNAQDINDRGQIVGSSGLPSDPTQSSHAFLWQNGKMTDLGKLPNGIYSMALAINERGQIAGWSDDSSSLEQAVLWTK